MSFHREKTVKIRKIQRCHGCCCRFPTGTKMKYTAGVYDSEFYASYYSQPCDDYIKKNPEEFEDGIFPGGVSESKMEREQNGN